MEMNDMMLISSVDDHISEPPDMFNQHLSGKALESAPKLTQDSKGKDLWVYQGMSFPSVGLKRRGRPPVRGIWHGADLARSAAGRCLRCA